ncbi:MAG TPA: glycosyltransferase family 4 protein [Flavipsychrobacter sp.]|nr:glycosyltransferase family 4 protein [Flavipsychrobacter sp.]
MKILIVMDPGILVPPKGYGGHERLVEMFAKEYVRRGHEVHLLVTKGSYVEGCTIHPLGEEGFPPSREEATAAVWRAWRFIWEHRRSFDLIHNFGRLFYLLPVLNYSVKKIMTYGREISKRNIQYVNKLPTKNLIFTGCSTDLISRGGLIGHWETVFNAIDFSKYTLNVNLSADAPLMFLGRIEEIKGCHTAIKVAKALNRRLIIAGNRSPLTEEQVYFEQQVAPHIDGSRIMYVGQVNDEQKNHYLQRSAALLFPIEWNEPFGMVMAEAMACGTPVIAFRRGSVDEVVEEGITGFKVKTMQEMIEAVKKIQMIDRQYCRQSAEERFDVKVIAKRYLTLHK